MKSLEHPLTDSALPKHIVKGTQQISNKNDIVNAFIDHFIKTGNLFEQSYPEEASRHVSSPLQHNSSASLVSEGFDFESIPPSAVLKALKEIDTRKSAGLKGLDPAFLKLSAHLIVEPIAYIFYLSLSSNDIPDVWKSAHVLPLLKGGDPFTLENYRPIFKLSVLAKILESLVNTQVKCFLQNHNILCPAQSGFRAKHHNCIY